jgi:cell division protein FtsL
LRPLKKMEENNHREQENKTPSKMARLAWPKAKYGVIIAIIIIVVVNLIYYKDVIKSFF